MASTTSAIHRVTDETFGPEVLKSETPVLVDYWAEWCGPCKSIAPILDEVAKEYEGRLKIAKMNVSVATPIRGLITKNRPKRMPSTDKAPIPQPPPWKATTRPAAP